MRRKTPTSKKHEHPQFYSPYPVIMLTLTPSSWDPTDQGPIFFTPRGGHSRGSGFVHPAGRLVSPPVRRHLSR
jgi:hypothetical protein